MIVVTLFLLFKKPFYNVDLSLFKSFRKWFETEAVWDHRKYSDRTDPHPSSSMCQLGDIQ